MGLILPDDTAIARWRAATLRTKEPATVAWIEAMPIGSVLWDVGANVGIYSLLAASEGHRVIAVEPLPANYAALCKAVAQNGFANQITTMAVALGESNGMASLHYEHDSAGLADVQASTGRPGAKLSVPMMRLDTAQMVCRLPGPTHIKIDVDGAELAVLRGAASILTSVESVIIETDEERSDIGHIDAVLQAACFTKRDRFVSPLFPHSSVGMDHWYRDAD